MNNKLDRFQPFNTAENPALGRRSVLGAVATLLGVGVTQGCEEPNPSRSGTLAQQLVAGSDYLSNTADLSTLSYPWSSIYIVEHGGSSTTNCSGGVFVWEPNDNSTIDDAIVVGPNFSDSNYTTAHGTNGRWIRQFSGPVDIRWFGAIPGVDTSTAATANSDAFQSAITTVKNRGGGTIFVPAGRWYIGSTIEIHNCEGVVVQGPGGPGTEKGGRNQTVIHWASSATNGGTMVSISGAENCRFEDIFLQGNSPGESNAGIGISLGQAISGVDSNTRNNTIARIHIDGIAGSLMDDDSGINIKIASPQQESNNPNVNGNIISHCTLENGVISIKQMHPQTVHNQINDCILYQYAKFGVLVEGGELRLSRNQFTSKIASNMNSQADVEVRVTALWCTIDENYHETFNGHSYNFPSGANARNFSSNFTNNRVLFRSDATTKNIINYCHAGPVVALGCTFDGYDSPMVQPKVAWNGVTGGTPLQVHEAGCNYINGATRTIDTAFVAFSSMNNANAPRLSGLPATNSSNNILSRWDLRSIAQRFFGGTIDFEEAVSGKVFRWLTQTQSGVGGRLELQKVASADPSATSSAIFNINEHGVAKTALAFVSPMRGTIIKSHGTKTSNFSINPAEGCHVQFYVNASIQVTLSAPSSYVPEAVRLTVEVAQGASGTGAIQWIGAAFANNTQPTITTTPSKTDVLEFIYNGGVWICVSITQNI